MIVSRLVSALPPGLVLAVWLSGSVVAGKAAAEPLPTLDESLATIAETRLEEPETQDVPLPGGFVLLLGALGTFVFLTGRTD